MGRFVLSAILALCGVGVVSSARAESTTGSVNTKSLSRLSAMVEEIEQAKLEEAEESAAKELVLLLARQHSASITLEELKAFNKDQIAETIASTAYALGAFALAAALLAFIYLAYGTDVLEGLAYVTGLILVMSDGPNMPLGQVGASLSGNILVSFGLLWRLHMLTGSGRDLASDRSVRVTILGAIALLWASSAVWCASPLLGGVAVVCFLIWLWECLIGNRSKARSTDEEGHRRALAGTMVATFGVLAQISGLVPPDFQWLVLPFEYTALRLGASVALGTLIVLALDSDSQARMHDILLLIAAGICMACGSAGIPALMGIASWSLVIWTITKISLIKTERWGLFMKFSAVALVCLVVGRLVQSHPQFFTAL
jgi:hypothetical protein